MKIVSRFKNFALILMLFLPSMACKTFVSPPQSDLPQQQQEVPPTSPPQAELPKQQQVLSPTSPPETELLNTTEPPTATQTRVQNTNTISTNPSCKVLRDLNFRSGPGEDYGIVDVLPPDLVLIPLGYNPNGVPGGRWIYAENSTNGQDGWVGAGPSNVSCNTDPAGLPVIVVEAPPTDAPVVAAALPSSVLGTPVDGGGTCGPPPDFPLDCGVTLADDTFIRFAIYQDGTELTRNEGVQQVDFTVRSPDRSRIIYSHTENNFPYCIFGGGDECSPWVFEDGIYKWSSGGEAVQDGTYNISIDSSVALSDLTFIHWEYLVDISLP